MYEYQNAGRIQERDAAEKTKNPKKILRPYRTIEGQNNVQLSEWPRKHYDATNEHQIKRRQTSHRRKEGYKKEYHDVSLRKSTNTEKETGSQPLSYNPTSDNIVAENQNSNAPDWNKQYFSIKGKKYYYNSCACGVKQVMPYVRRNKRSVIR